MRVSAHSGFLLTLFMVCSSVNAAEPGSDLPENFLEYLGSLVDQDGAWVDALELDGDVISDSGGGKTSGEVPDGVEPDKEEPDKEVPDKEALVSSSDESSSADDDAEK